MISVPLFFVWSSACIVSNEDNLIGHSDRPIEDPGDFGNDVGVDSSLGGLDSGTDSGTDSATSLSRAIVEVEILLVNTLDDPNTQPSFTATYAYPGILTVDHTFWWETDSNFYATIAGEWDIDTQTAIVDYGEASTASQVYQLSYKVYLPSLDPGQYTIEVEEESHLFTVD